MRPKIVLSAVIVCSFVSGAKLTISTRYLLHTLLKQSGLISKGGSGFGANVDDRRGAFDGASLIFIAVQSARWQLPQYYKMIVWIHIKHTAAATTTACLKTLMGTLHFVLL